MAPEPRPHPPRPHVPECTGSRRAGGAPHLGGPAPPAGDRAGVVERSAVVLPGSDPPRELARLELPPRALEARQRVALRPPLPQHAPRVATPGPLPRLTVAPRQTRCWTPWQHLCAALLKDAVKSAFKPVDPKVGTRASRQRIADLRW